MELAGSLATSGGRSGTVRRRAVSTAYYALFHGLQELCADKFVGRDARRNPNYEIVYRSLEHGPTKDAFTRDPLRSHARIRLIGAVVIDLQGLRHKADYATLANLFNRRQCWQFIERARQSLFDLRHLDADDKLLLAVNLLFRAGKRSP